MSKKLIRFDWAVKKLLRNKANFVVLEGFLSELLFEDIHIQEILESESNQQTEDDKFNKVDILTQNSKNELVIILFCVSHSKTIVIIANIGIIKLYRNR
ncbi:MAG: hypothetical protein MUE81_06020 [Thermoflexibacter sp.]|jgi:hypothetical protein|nr:hypothetical protein [Thermoflexibacter sp.]